MDITVTIIVQSIAFVIFVLLTMRWIWPVIIKAINDRQTKISDGLAAAERGTKALQEASARSEEVLRQARAQAQEILANANKQAGQLVDQGRESARSEGERLIEEAKSEVGREVTQAREELRRQVGQLAVVGAERILKREIDAKAHADVLNDLATQI
jgi:F-type H+-transporting ATPase subunit b